MRKHEQLLFGKARDRLASPSAIEKRYLTHLAVKKADRIVILRIAEIEAIESAGNYVVVQAGKNALIVRETLAALSDQLEPGKFMRISRSAIVNLEHVKELLPNFVGDKVVV